MSVVVIHSSFSMSQTYNITLSESYSFKGTAIKMYGLLQVDLDTLSLRLQ